jgi:phage terminase large subunit-like protein
MLRDGLQSRILGDVASGQVGTDIMPAENIVSLQMARGIAGAVDSTVIRRADGTTAVIRFKTNDQGREAAQSESVDFVVCDEMPTDMGLWSELLARLSATSGRIWLTATPRKQQSAIAHWFKEADHPERQVITATIADAAHLTDTMRQEMIDRFKNNPAEANTRLWGMDFAGGGQIFNTPMADYVATFDPADFPSYYKWIIGLDPSHGGLSESAHPAGAVLCCLNPDSQTLFVCDTIRLRNALPETLVRSILAWPQGDAPVAWGAAENQGIGGAPQTYAQMFKGLGLNTLREHSQFKTGGYALEPSLDLIEQMMAGGKLKIHRRCADLFEEIQGYERDETSGKPIALRDDLIAALRYAVLSMRFAKVLDPERPGHRGIYRGVPIGQGLRRGRDADKSYVPDGSGSSGGYTDFGS